MLHFLQGAHPEAKFEVVTTSKPRENGHCCILNYYFFNSPNFNSNYIKTTHNKQINKQHQLEIIKIDTKKDIFAHMKGRLEAANFHHRFAVEISHNIFGKPILTWRSVASAAEAGIIGKNLNRLLSEADIDNFLKENLYKAAMGRDQIVLWIHPKDDCGNVIKSTIWVAFKSKAAAAVIKRTKWEVKGREVHWSDLVYTEDANNVNE